jgi:flagellin-like protein
MIVKMNSMIQDRRAQVGIGTLIIFIAMVLVAAVAAAVLIQTSGVLQQKAQTTGKEATKEVSSNIDIDSIEGWRGGIQASTSDPDTFSSTIYRLDLRISLKVGSEPVDMNQAVLTITDGTTTNDMRYIEGELVTEWAYVGTGNGSKAPSAAGGITNTTYRILVDGAGTQGTAGHDDAMEIFKRIYPDARVDADYNPNATNGTAVLWSHSPSEGSGDVIAVDAGMFSTVDYGDANATTQDHYLARADKLYIIEEIRDEDKSFTKANPVMNTGDLMKLVILTAPDYTVTGNIPYNSTVTGAEDPELENNHPLVGEGDLTLAPRTTVGITLIPEGGASTTVSFVTPSSFGTYSSVDLYP